MEKVRILLLVIGSSLAFTCSRITTPSNSSLPGSDCGCDGKTTTEVLTNIVGTVDYPSQDSYFRIFIKEGSAIVPCNLPDSTLAKFKIDKLKVKLSGDRKANCPNWRTVGDPVVIRKIEAL